MSAGGAPEFPGVEPGRRAWLYAILARAELALEPPGRGGGVGGARRGRRRRPRPPLRRGRRPVRARPARPRAPRPPATATPRPHPPAPLDAALRAAELADSVGAVIQAGRARTLAGRAADDEIGVSRCSSARSPSWARCGAVRLRDEAARELRRRGVKTGARRRRATGGEGLASLSGREREVADLVALGPHQQGDRRRAVPVGEDRREPHEPAVRQARRALARRGRRGRRPRARRLISAGTRGPPTARASGPARRSRRSASSQPGRSTSTSSPVKLPSTSSSTPSSARM